MQILILPLLEAAKQGGGSSSLIWFLLLFVLIWILMMRPQRKKEKEERKFRDELQKGDRVIFSGGIYGKVHEVKDTTVEVSVGNNVILTVEKSMIQPAPGEQQKNETKSETDKESK